MSVAEKSHVTMTRYYIAVKPDGHVVICCQDMHSGNVKVMPLMVDLDGWVRVVKPEENGGQDE